MMVITPPREDIGDGAMDGSSSSSVSAGCGQPSSCCVLRKVSNSIQWHDPKTALLLLVFSNPNS
jgi:hypothetical protein